MRDSALKRALVRLYFDAKEVLAAGQGLFSQAKYPAGAIDYDHYWGARAPGAVQARFEVLAAHIEPGATLLDIGCGDGAMIEFLSRVKPIRATGLDISACAVERACGRGVDARRQTLSEFRSTSARIFDHVVLSEVIEHVADPEQLAHDAWTLAGRTLWISFPNIAYFPHRLKLLAGGFPVQWVVFPGEHLRFWSAADFRRWLDAVGLPPARWYPTTGIQTGGLYRRWPNLLANQILVGIDRPSASASESVL